VKELDLLYGIRIDQVLIDAPVEERLCYRDVLINRRPRNLVLIEALKLHPLDIGRRYLCQQDVGTDSLLQDR